MPPLLQARSPAHDAETHHDDEGSSSVERSGLGSRDDPNQVTNLESLASRLWRRDSPASHSSSVKFPATKSVQFASRMDSLCPNRLLPTVPRNELWYTPNELSRIRRDCAQTVQQRMALMDLLQPSRDGGIYDRDSDARYSIRGLEHRCVNTRYARYRKAIKEQATAAILNGGSTEDYIMYSEQALESAHLQALHDERVAKEFQLETEVREEPAPQPLSAYV